MKKFNIRYDVLRNGQVILSNLVYSIKASTEGSAYDRFIDRVNKKYQGDMIVNIKDIYEVL